MLLDTFCGSDAPVSSLALFHGFVVSASTAADVVLLWSLKYDARHKPRARAPAGSAHIAVTKDGDRIFYVHQQSHTEVTSWDSNTGQTRRRHQDIIRSKSIFSLIID